MMSIFKGCPTLNILLDHKVLVLNINLCKVVFLNYFMFQVSVIIACPICICFAILLQ